MRDLAMFVLIFGSLPIILYRPWIGIIVWSFVGYGNFHRLSWGPAFDFPFAMVVVITLFIAIVLSKEKYRFPFSPIIFVWVAFILWMCVTSVFAFYPDFAFPQLSKILKIQLLTFITVALINSKKRLDVLLVTIVLCIGFYGVKGGIFTLRGGGAGLVWGPPGGFIEDNNALAVALLMIIPLALYVRYTFPQRWVRLAVPIGVVCTLFAALGSQSRGGFLAMGAMIVFLIAKSRYKLISILAFAMILPFAWNFMPQEWHDRMATIRNYEEDPSAMGRINAWWYSYHVANDRITGAGLESWSDYTFAIYAPVADDVHAAHSIYFAVLGDHGWIGALLFLSTFALAWREISKFSKKARGHPELEWAIVLGQALKVGFVAYATGGAFLSLAYFDLPWHMIAIALIVRTLVDKVVAAKQTRQVGAEPVDRYPRTGYPSPDLAARSPPR